MYRVVFAILSIVVSATIVTADQSSEPVSPKLAIGSPAPDFELTDQAGKRIKLSDFSGKIVVLHWTNAQCPFVQRHYHENTWNKIAEKYRAKNVVVFGIDSSNFISTPALAAAFSEHNLVYQLLNDREGTVGKLYGAKTTPHVFIIDSAGKLAYQGAIDDDALGELPNRKNYVTSALDALIAGKPIAVATTRSYGCSVKYAG